MTFSRRCHASEIVWLISGRDANVVVHFILLRTEVQEDEVRHMIIVNAQKSDAVAGSLLSTRLLHFQPHVSF